MRWFVVAWRLCGGACGARWPACSSGSASGACRAGSGQATAQPARGEEHKGPAERSVDARSHLPAAAQLASWAEQKDWTAVAEFAEELAQRRDQLWDRGRDVATREQELAQRSPGIATEGAVPAAAAAARLRTLTVETGDDVATVAATSTAPCA